MENTKDLTTTIKDEIDFLQSLLDDKLDGDFRITDTASRSTMMARISVLKEELKK